MISLFPLLSMLLSTNSPNLTATSCNFGEIYQGNNVKCEILLTNPTEHVQTVYKGTLSSPAVAGVEPSEIEIQPRSTATLNVVLDLRASSGVTNIGIDLRERSAKGDLRVNAGAYGYVQSILDTPLTTLDYGVVESAKAASVSKIFTPASTEFPDLRISGIALAPDYVDVVIDEQRREAKITLKHSIPWGLVNDYVYFRTTSTLEPEIAVKLHADVHGDVVPSSNPYGFGLMRQGNKNEALIRLNSKSGKAFKIGKIRVDTLHATVSSEKCIPASADCRLIRFVLDKDQPFGNASGKIVVELPEFHRDLPIDIWGLYVKRDTVIKSLDSTASEKNTPSGESVARARSQDIGAALAKSVQKSQKKEDSAPVPGRGPLLKWSTKNESTVYGYSIYRGVTDSGPFKRINQDIIRINDTPNQESSSYQWRDTTAEPGKTYWYRIDVLFNDGTRKKLSGAQKILAK